MCDPREAAEIEGGNPGFPSEGRRCWRNGGYAPGRSQPRRAREEEFCVCVCFFF